MKIQYVTDCNECRNSRWMIRGADWIYCTQARKEFLHVKGSIPNFCPLPVVECSGADCHKEVGKPGGLCAECGLETRELNCFTLETLGSCYDDPAERKYLEKLGFRFCDDKANGCTRKDPSTLPILEAEKISDLIEISERLDVPLIISRKKIVIFDDHL